jgi:hypothetical protein
MPRLKNRPKKILKSYRLDKEIVDALELKVNESKDPVTETDIVVKLLRKGLGFR